MSEQLRFRGVVLPGEECTLKMVHPMRPFVLGAHYIKVVEPEDTEGLTLSGLDIGGQYQFGFNFKHDQLKRTPVPLDVFSGIARFVFDRITDQTDVAVRVRSERKEWVRVELLLVEEWPFDLDKIMTKLEARGY